MRPDQINDEKVRKMFQPNIGKMELQGVFVSRKDAQTEINLGRNIGAVGESRIFPLKNVYEQQPGKKRDAFGAYIERRY